MKLHSRRLTNSTGRYQQAAGTMLPPCRISSRVGRSIRSVPPSSADAPLLEPGRPRILVSFRHLLIELKPDPRPIRHRDTPVLDDVALVSDDRRPVVAVE